MWAKDPPACTLALGLGSWNSTVDGQEALLVEGRIGASPAEGQGTPLYSYWEEGTTTPRVWTCQSRKRSHLGALLYHPGVSVSALLEGSSQDPGQRPGEGGCGAVQLFPGLWRFSDLSGHPWGLRLQWLAGFCAYLLGVGCGRSYLALGTSGLTVFQDTSWSRLWRSTQRPLHRYCPQLLDTRSCKCSCLFSWAPFPGLAGTRGLEGIQSCASWLGYRLLTRILEAAG